MAGLKKMKNAKKTVIYLDEADHKAVKYQALTSGVSMAELIRRAIVEYLKNEPGPGGARMCSATR